MSAPKLRLLGGLDWSTSAPEAKPRLGRKPYALLALIAAHGARGAPREWLVGLLWGEQDERSGAVAMRQCLHQLRHTLGEAAEAIEAGRDRIAMRRGYVDVLEFAELAVRQDAASLQRAAVLYRGDFAAGLADFGDASGRYVQAERMRLRGLALEVVARLAARREVEPASRVAAGLARQLFATDPAHEGCCRSLMLLLERDGLRAEALRVYGQCRQALRGELGVEPCAETEALARRMRVASSPAAGPDAAASAADTGELQRSNMTMRIGRVENHPSATDHVLRAWQLFSRSTVASNQQARIELEAALAIDPRSVPALCLLGWTHWFDWIRGSSDNPELSYRYACDQARRAFAIGGPESLSPHALQAKLDLWKMRHDEALEHARAAVATLPADGWRLFHLADVLMHCGFYDEALRKVRIAIDMEPNEFAVFRTIEAMTLYFCGDLGAARRSVESAVIRNPDYPWALRAKAVVLSELGDYESARAAAQRARELVPPGSGGFPEWFLPLRIAADRQRVIAAFERIVAGVGANTALLRKVSAKKATGSARRQA